MNAKKNVLLTVEQTNRLIKKGSLLVIAGTEKLLQNWIKVTG